MMRGSSFLLHVFLFTAAMSGVAEAQKLPNPVVPRPNAARAGRGQNPAESPLADQPNGRAAGRSQPATGKPDQSSKPANDLPKLTQQQQRAANLIERTYLLRVKSQVGLTDAQDVKVGDGLQRYLRRSMVLGVQRTEILERIQRLTEQKGSPEELREQKFREQNQLLMMNQNQQRRAEDNFYTQILPDLNPEQQGRLRLFMSETNKQILQAIQESLKQPAK